MTPMQHLVRQTTKAKLLPLWPSQAKPTPPPKSVPNYVTKNGEIILKLRAEGVPDPEIGERIGLSRSSVVTIASQYKRAKEQGLL